MEARLSSGWPNLALSAARMMSQFSAISHPIPNAKPATAAISGLRVAAKVSIYLCIFSSSVSLLLTFSIRSLTSIPAAKALSLPRMIIALTHGSSSKALVWLVSSRSISSLTALSAFGRFRVIMPTFPLISLTTVFNSITTSTSCF